MSSEMKDHATKEAEERAELEGVALQVEEKEKQVLLDAFDSPLTPGSWKAASLLMHNCLLISNPSKLAINFWLQCPFTIPITVFLIFQGEIS